MKSGNFTFEQLAIKDVYLITPKVYGDTRGYFLEAYSERDFEAVGNHEKFVQVNQSKSVKGVLRGLHYQKKHPQGKLVKVIQGEVFDVAVDLRENSITFGQYVSTVLNDENHQSLYIPPGFAHGFMVLSQEAIFTYQTTDFYYPEYDAGIKFDDPKIDIKWPSIDTIILSDKDRQLPYLKI